MRHMIIFAVLLTACASEEVDQNTTPVPESQNTPAISNAVGSPYANISPAAPDVLTAVAQSYVFMGMLGKLMEGYRPVLPTVEDPDMLRCMTEEAFTYDAELKSLEKRLEKQVREAEAAREAAEQASTGAIDDEEDEDKDRRWELEEE